MATYCLFIRVLGGFQSIADTFAGWTATQEFVETPISASHKIGSDPRLGTITLETWSTKARKMDRGRDKKRSGAQKSADVTTASFEPILESSVALSAGIIHLYKERLNESSFVFPSAAPDPRVSVEQPILGILAVPSYMSPKDLLNFLGPLSEHILHLRILRDATPNRYMVVLKMKGKEAAASLLEELNGVKYHSLEPETCHIVRVSHVQVHHQGSELLDDSSTSVPSSVPSLSMLKKSPSLYLTELPNCPVCLERMDAAVTGLLTIICTHTFHCHCIAKWGDGSCPVCRYSSSKDVADSGKESACGVCGTELDLWICLICGIVGCGRYKVGPSFA